MSQQSQDQLTPSTKLQVLGGRVSPATAGVLTPMPCADYGDLFTLRCPGASRWTAEMWARAIFGDSPDWAERLIWQGLLHLRLTRGTLPDHVAGWPVVDRSDGYVRLATLSWFLSGNLIVSTGPDSVSLGTFVRYDRRLAAAVWLPLSLLHRRLMPGLLRDAHQALSMRAAEAGLGSTAR